MIAAWRTLAAAAFVAAAAAAVAGETGRQPSARQPAAAVERGSEVAQARCAACHAVALETVSPSRDAPQFRVLSRLYSAEDLRRKLADIAEHGHFEMPAVSIREDEIEDVSAYIESLQADPDPSATPI